MGLKPRTTELAHGADLLTTYANRRVPDHARHQVRMSVAVDGPQLTLLEHRPVWNDPHAAWTAMPIARFDLDPADGLWCLWWVDQHQQWHPFNAPRAHLADLIAVVDRDPTHIFWG